MQQQGFSSMAKCGDGHICQPILHSTFEDASWEHFGALCQGLISGAPGDDSCRPLGWENPSWCHHWKWNGGPTANLRDGNRYSSERSFYPTFWCSSAPLRRNWWSTSGGNAVVSVPRKWNLEENIVALCFDTTSSNTPHMSSRSRSCGCTCLQGPPWILH